MPMTRPSAAEKLAANGHGRPRPSAGPPPQKGQPWPAITPFAEVPDADPFPLEVLPERLRAVVLEAAAALNAPPDFVAVPLLAFAGAAIGMTRSLEVARGHKQGPLLYAGVVGLPGSAKSPALSLVRRPFDAIQREHQRIWEAEMVLYRQAAEEYEAARKSRKGREGPAPVEPERPVLRRVVVENTTPESLIPILRHNPRGVVSVRDELTAWTDSFDAYKSGGKGSEKQFWMSNWSNEPIYVDRRQTYEDGPLHVAAPFIAVVGNLTPDGLASLKGDPKRQRDDGFIDRVLLSYPKPLPARGETWESISPEAEATLDAVIRELFDLGMIALTAKGSKQPIGFRPLTVPLDPDARLAWQAFTEADAAEVNAEDFQPWLRGPWAKLRGYCVRFALILHYLGWSCLERERRDEPVGGGTMRAAVELVSYFKSHAKKAHAAMEADRHAADAARLLAAAVRHRDAAGPGPFAFTVRDAYRWARGRGVEKPDDVRPLLDVLEAHGLVRPGQQPERAGVPGRKPSDPYELNPAATCPKRPSNPRSQESDYESEGVES